MTDLVRRSGFIFEGTVKEIGASTPSIARGPNTAIVAVDRVVEALPPVGNLKGKEVTVRLKNPAEVRVGQSLTFFTTVYSAGKTLGVDEVGTLPIAGEQAMDTQIRGVRQTLADQALAARLASAELVVLGVVGEPKPTEEAKEREGEHDALWWSAPIRVETTLKGNPGNAPVVYFATSDDPIWVRSPKLKAGEEGIFVLQPDPGKKLRAPGPCLVDPLDFASKNDLDRIRRLLNTPR
jgi:hypothetical protein